MRLDGSVGWFDNIGATMAVTRSDESGRKVIAEQDDVGCVRAIRHTEGAVRGGAREGRSVQLGGINIGEVQRVLSRHPGNGASEEIRGVKVDRAGSTSKRDVTRVGAAQLDRSTCADGQIVRSRLERFILAKTGVKGHHPDELARIVDGGGLVIQP